MKRLFKKLAQTLWRMSAPVSRPFICKFDQHMIQLIGSSSLRVDAPANLDLALSSVVRELTRLQIQVEILQQQIDDLESSGRDGARSESRLSVVGEIG